jgi:hypothetical protein
VARGNAPEIPGSHFYPAAEKNSIQSACGIGMQNSNINIFVNHNNSIIVNPCQPKDDAIPPEGDTGRDGLRPRNAPAPPTDTTHNRGGNDEDPDRDNAVAKTDWLNEGVCDWLTFLQMEGASQVMYVNVGPYYCALNLSL